MLSEAFSRHSTLTISTLRYATPSSKRWVLASPGSISPRSTRVGEARSGSTGGSCSARPTRVASSTKLSHRSGISLPWNIEVSGPTEVRKAASMVSPGFGPHSICTVQYALSLLTCCTPA